MAITTQTDTSTELDTPPQEARNEAPAQSPPSKQPAMKLGPLLDEKDEEKAFRDAKRLWDRNKKWHHRLAAVWMQNGMWREGERFLKIIEDPSTGQIRIAQPLGTSLIPPVPNACDSKIRANISIFLADPPRPECEPWDDTPKARNAAAFATRLLALDAGEAGLNTDQVLANALDVAGTKASAFTIVETDPKGAGLQPKTVKAHPDAMTEAEAETGPPGAPMKAPVVRYVMPDGTLGKESKGSLKEWTPKIVLRTVDGNHLRFLPRNVTGIEEAKGIIFASWDSLGSLKGKYERVAKMSDEELLNLCNWRLDEWKRLLPPGMDPEGINEKYSTDKLPDDDALVLTLHVYYKSHTVYPYGAYACFGGGKYRLYKRTWTAPTPDGNEGEQDEALDLPVAQMRWWQDAQGGNPYGKAPASKLGPIDETRASQFAALQEYTYRFNRPRPFLPMGTTVQPEDLADLDKPIYVPPNGQPFFAPVPQFPRESMELVDRMSQEMDDELSVPDAARGVAAGSVRSAEQQKAIIEQGLAGTSVVRNNIEDYYERLHRLILQQRRAFFRTSQLMRYQGDGGAFMVQDYRNVDLGATREVRVRKGTLTLMAPTARAALISEKMQAGMISQQEAMRLDRENLAPILGVTENPHVEDVKRQIWLWRQGPSDAVKEAQPQPQVDPNTGQPAIDPMTGQPIIVDPIAQAAQQIFTQKPIHADPGIALLRYQELGNACADAELSGFPESWVQTLYQVTEMARQAAGIMTVQEQAQAAQMQAQQEAQAKAQEHAQESGEREKDRQAASDSQAAKEQATLDREAIKAAAPQSGMLA